MDNVCHTLAGAALAEAGLRRRTPLAVPTLLIGANLPDVDALAYLKGPLAALEVRRGWTHGVLAMVVLPCLLTCAMLAWDRLARHRDGAARAEPRALLLVAAVAVLSHPLLDLLNPYGVRLLMPFSGRWFRGDALFIVDPWLWLMFGAAAGLAAWRRARGASRERAERPARVGLGLAVAYVGLMAGAGLTGRRVVRAAAAAAGVGPVQELMLAPVPLNPLRRSIVLSTAAGYRRGRVEWPGSPRVALDSIPTPRGLDSPPARSAAASAEGAAFLRWARFPAAVVRPTPGGWLVRLYDLRYAGPEEGGWAAVEIPVAGERASSGCRGPPIVGR